MRNKEAFLQHHVMGHLKELSDGYGTKLTFTNTIILKGELLKHENELGFFRPAEFAILHSSRTNPCQYSATVLKGQKSQDRLHVKSFENFLRRKAKITTSTLLR